MVKKPQAELILISKELDPDSHFILLNENYKENLFFNFDKVTLLTPKCSIGNIKDYGIDKVILDVDIFNFNAIDLLHSLFDKNGVKHRRVGWYMQQLIKLCYSYSCSYEYYVTWDIDTVPLRKLKFFDSNRPIINIGRKWRDPDFDAGIMRLFGQLRKSDFTYITEYMVFNKRYVQEMLAGFGDNMESCIENILTITMYDFKKDCLSEFEVYGTYLELSGLLEEYQLKKIKSYRNALNIAPWRNLKAKLSLLQRAGYSYSSIEDQHSNQSFRIKNIALSLYLELRNFLK